MTTCALVITLLLFYLQRNYLKMLHASDLNLSHTLALSIKLVISDDKCEVLVARTIPSTLQHVQHAAP